MRCPSCACQLNHHVWLCPVTLSTRRAQCPKEAHAQQRAAVDIATQQQQHSISKVSSDMCGSRIDKLAPLPMQAYWQNRAAVKAAAEERLRMSLYKSCGKVPSYR